MPFKIDVKSTPRQTPGQTVGANSYVIEKLNNSLLVNVEGGDSGDDLIDDGLLFDYDAGNIKSYPGAGTNISDIKDSGDSTAVDIILSYDPGNALSYPGTGTKLTDLSGKKNDGTLIGSGSETTLFPVKFRDAKTASTSAIATNTIKVAKPAGLAVGDLLVAGLLITNNTTPGVWGTATFPTGFTQQSSIQADVNAWNKLIVGTKIATAADVAAADFTFGYTETNGPYRLAAILASYYDVDATSPLDVTSTTQNNPTNTGTVVAPTITPSNGKEKRLLTFYAISDGNAIVDTLNLTPPTGQTERAEISGVSGGTPQTASYGRVMLADEAYQATATSGTRTATHSGTVESMAINVMLRSRESATGTGVTYSSAEGGLFTLNGTNGLIATANEISNPQTFSVGIWFKTAANKGKIIGFANQKQTSETVFDRQIYLASDGKLNCGIYDPTNTQSNWRVITSNVVVNDNLWHYAVYTYGSGVLKLYVDGIFQNEISGTPQNYNGYWKIGGINYTDWPDNLSSGTKFSSSSYFAGSVGAAHVYTVVLTDSQIKQNFNAFCERKGVNSLLDGPWSEVSKNSSYVEEDATEGDTLYFRSKYTQSDGRTSPYSDPINVVVGSQTAGPAAPSFTLTAGATSITINISATPGSKHRIKNYTIQKFIKTQPESTITSFEQGNGTWQDLATQTQSSYVDSNLTSGLQYIYRVKFTQQNGIESTFSDPQSVFTTTTPTTLTAPTVTAKVDSSTQITLNITAKPLTGSTVTSYTIERSINQTNWSTQTVSSTSSTYAYADSGLSPNITYYYRVKFKTSTNLLSPDGFADAKTLDDETLDIVVDGLQFAYDPGDNKSYVSGTTILDLKPVTTPRPIAGFTTSATTINTGQTVTFTDTSQNAPTSWLWKFIDGGNTSTLQNPTYKFDNAGSFDVELTATNSAGSDTITKRITVTVPAVDLQYPRLGTYLLGPSTTNLDRIDISDALACGEVHHLLLDQQFNATSIRTILQIIRTKAAPLKQYYYAYFAINEAYRDIGNDTSTPTLILRPAHNKFNAMNWWLYPNSLTSGDVTKASNADFGADLAEINLTTYSPKDSRGVRPGEWWAEAFFNRYFRSGANRTPTDPEFSYVITDARNYAPEIDGVYYDNLFFIPRAGSPGSINSPTISNWNRTGSGDLPSDIPIAKAWRDGFIEAANKFKTLTAAEGMPKGVTTNLAEFPTAVNGGFPLSGKNTADYGARYVIAETGGSKTDFHKVFDGGVIEYFAGTSFSSENGLTVDQLINGYTITSESMIYPERIVNHIVCDSGDYQFAAYGLALTTVFGDAATYIAPTSAKFAGSISGTTLTVTSVTSGKILINSFLSGREADPSTKTVIPFTKIISGPSSGGVGTYTIDTSQNITSSSFFAGGLLISWLDEMSVNRKTGVCYTGYSAENVRTGLRWLGKATEGPVKTAWKDEIYRRKFEYGEVYLNYRGKSTKTVTLDQPMRTISGTQRPTVNNGTVVTQITLPARSAIFLLYKLDDAPTPITPKPVANFTASKTSVLVNETIQFTDTSTNTPTSWAWDFQNNGSNESTIRNPTYSYPTAGVYSVKLTATNANGSDEEIKTNFITVTASPPAAVASFTATPETGVRPLQVTFADTSINSPTSWSWDFTNDGTIDSTAQNPPVQTYNTAGDYTVRLTVSNGNGTPSSTTKLIRVTNPPTFTTLRINAGGPTFTDPSGNQWLDDTPYVNTGNKESTAAAIDNTTNDVLYQTGRWDSSTSPAMIYTFTVPNDTYVVRLHFAELFTQITAAGQRVFGIKINGNTVISDLDIFANAGLNAAMMRDYTVNVTNGSITIEFVHVTENPKISGIEIYKSGTQPALPTGPTAGFTASATTITAGQSVTFTDTSTGPSGITLRRQWDFLGDGGAPDATNSDGRAVSYTFSTVGTFKTKLTVLNPYGSSSREVTITVNAVVNQPGPSGPGPTTPSKLETLRTNILGKPWGMAFLPDGRMLMTLRDSLTLCIYTAAQINTLNVNDTQNGPSVSIDMKQFTSLGIVRGGGQSGLMDIVVDPDFATNSYIFFTYSKKTGGDDASPQMCTAVGRAKLIGNNLSEVTEIYAQNYSSTSGNHFGSRIAIHPIEKYLYVSFGERGSRQGPAVFGGTYRDGTETQGLEFAIGKIIRIDRNGVAPTQNRQFNGALNGIIWSKGHRNPQGIGFRPSNNQLWSTEQAEDGGDEINLILPGKDYGWPTVSYGFEYAWKYSPKFRGSISDTTLTVTSFIHTDIKGFPIKITGINSDPAASSAQLSGTDIPSGTKILQQLTGEEGGVGTYRISRSLNLSEREINSGTWLTDPTIRRPLTFFGGGSHSARGFEEPKFIWPQRNPANYTSLTINGESAATSGLCFYSGKIFGQWYDNIFVTCLSGPDPGQAVWRIPLSGDNVDFNNVEDIAIRFPTLRQRMRHIIEGPDGFLYIINDSAYISANNPPATLYRIRNA